MAGGSCVEVVRIPSGTFSRAQRRSTSADGGDGRADGALRTIATRFDKQRAKLKDELRGWKRSISGGGTGDREGVPTLVSVEPLLDTPRPGARIASYRATLRLRKSGHEHTWQTEPFTLDDLVSVVVSTRIACATKWCNAHICRQKRSGLLSLMSKVPCCLLRTLAFWCVMSALVVKLSARLQPLLHIVHTSDGNLAAWALAVCIASTLLVFAAGLLAGITEISFLPARAILHLERKDETAQVESQLKKLLDTAEALKQLEICNFLNLGMATYYNSSETRKEGRCFYRRHESPDEYFTRARQRRWNFLFFTCDCRCRFRRRQQRGLEEQWLVLRKDGIALFPSIMEKDPTDMLFFDTSFMLFRDDDDRVLVRGASWLLELDFSGSRTELLQRSVQSWCNEITLTAKLSPRTCEQRFGAFAPVRYPGESKQGDRHLLRRSMAKFTICGRSTFKAVAEAIMLAEHEILILGFWISPHLQLLRGDRSLPDGGDSRLSTLLRNAADRGVRVFVLLYHEVSMFVPNDSEHAQRELNHPNIFVARHRSRFDSNTLWTHHEKVVVVDQQLAIMGGIDLCLGRWDDSSHRLRDCPAQIFEGQDYSNPRIKDFSDVRTNADTLDRESQPRMPWQDVQCVLLGRPARDVARHCIERWNHARSMLPRYAHFPTLLLQRKVAVCNDKMVALAASQEEDGQWPPEACGFQPCIAQVVRSVGRWSAGTRTESSAHAAYCELIHDAERYVYIENQFFVSGLEADEAVGNRVAEALLRRIFRAHSQREPFHVMIVLPLLPGILGALVRDTTLPVIQVMHWQYRTLRMLRQRLKEGGADPDDYISVYGLRTYERFPNGKCITEQIYVHSKLMIVDDRVSVIGSANINDRSLLGIRDSELNVVLRDAELTDSRMAGADWKIGVFSSQLRRALLAQHVGWSAEELQGAFADPLSPETLGELRRVARLNTEIYKSLFGVLPNDDLRTWTDLAEARRIGARPSLEPRKTPPGSPKLGRAGFSQAPDGDATREPTAAELARLGDIRGHIVEFPLDFLVEEDLTPPKFSVSGLTPVCFT